MVAIINHCWLALILLFLPGTISGGTMKEIQETTTNRPLGRYVCKSTGVLRLIRLIYEENASKLHTIVVTILVSSIPWNQFENSFDWPKRWYDLHLPTLLLKSGIVERVDWQCHDQMFPWTEFGWHRGCSYPREMSIPGCNEEEKVRQNKGDYCFGHFFFGGRTLPLATMCHFSLPPLRKLHIF